MGFVKDAACNVEEVVEPLADQLVRRVTGPAAECLIGFDDASIGAQRQISAGRIFVEVLQVLFDVAGVRQSFASQK